MHHVLQAPVQIPARFHFQHQLPKLGDHPFEKVVSNLWSSHRSPRSGLIIAILVTVNSSIANRGPSRPIPEFLTPP